MASPELLAGVMLAALVVYAISGGADFGGGVWDLVARGPRAAEHRRLIEGALAPVWEANHVWLILVVVVLFTAFPTAFSALATRHHGLLTAVLLGIVLRGSALVFRQYGGGGASAARWGAVFAAASATTPFFLGLVLAGVTAGAAVGTAFALSLAALSVALCAYLAAVYLGVEAHDRAPDLAPDFRRRAIAAWIAVAIAAAATGATAAGGAPRFAGRLFGSGWSPALLAATALCAAGALAAVWRGWPRAARALAIAQVVLLVVGWGAAQHPLLIAPDVDLASAAAPPATLELMAPVLAVGAVVVLPPFYWLMRVFKGQRPP